MAESVEHPSPQAPPGPAPKKIFISHASPDASTARRLTDALEAAHFACWIAPRDVPPGHPYSAAIVEAINSCSVVVLIYSVHAAGSAHVLREIERASSKNRTVIPIRVDRAELPPSLEYFLSATQWIDHSPSNIEQVAPSVIAAIDRAQAVPVRPLVAKRPRHRWLMAACALLVIAALLWVWRSRGMLDTAGSSQRIAATAADAEKSVAVLPFVDMSEKKDQEFFADGIAEEISTRLAEIPRIHAIGHASAFQFKGSNQDLRTIGDKLGAAYLVEGSVRRAQDRIRVTAKLIDARAGTQLWAETFDNDYQNVLETQQQIALGITRALQLFVAAADTVPAGKLKNAESYALYLRGQSELDQMHQSSLFDAQSSFERALELDPTSLGAAEFLALTYIEQGIDESLPPRTAWQKAREAAQRALTLNPDSAIAQGALGMVLAVNDYDLDGAEAQFRKVLEKHPREPVTLRFAALVAHSRGRAEDALRLINEAISIDPLNPWNYLSKGQMLLMSGDPERAEVAFKKSSEVTPLFDGVHFYRAMILLQRGDLDGGRVQAMAEVAENARDSGMSMEFFARGLKAQSDSALARLIQSSKDRWPTGISEAYAFRHDWPHTLQWIETAYELRDPDLLVNIRGDAMYAPIRSDPRFQAIIKKMNLAN